MSVPNVWTGELGEFWSRRAEQYERLMARHARRVVDAAALAVTDRVLDVGCGTGPTTRLAGERAASALGLDVSPAMVEVARARTEQANVTYEVADAQTAALPRADVVISQFGLMFFDDPERAFANLHHALERGGRLAFLCWRDHDENEGRTLPREVAARHIDVPPRRPPGGPGAFSLSDREVVLRLLESAGFSEVSVTAVDEPMTWGNSVDDALDFLFDDELDWVDADVRPAVAADLRRELEARAGAGEVVLRSAAWLVTARR